MDTRRTVIPAFSVGLAVVAATFVVAATVALTLAPSAAAAIENPPVFESLVAGDGDHLDDATGLAVASDGTLYGCGSIWHDATGYDITVTCFADAPLGWTMTWVGAGRNDEDTAVDIAVAADGSVYVYGSEAGGQDAHPILLKYSSTGALLWEAREASRPWGYARQIALDGDSNVYACSVEDNEESGGTYVVLTKYRPSGAVAWSKPHLVPSYKVDMHPADLVVTDGGVSYVCGSASGTELGRRAFLVCFRTGGSKRWSRVYTGPGSKTAGFSALALFPAGGVYAAGFATSDARDLLLTRYAANGDRTMTRRLGVGDGRRQWATDVAVDSLGRLAVCGTWQVSNRGYYVALLRRDGTVKWSHNYRGDATYAWGRKIAVDAADRVCVSGNAPGTRDAGEAYRRGPIATYAFSSAGALRWSFKWPAAFTPSTAFHQLEVHDIAAWQSSNVWVCGSSDDRPGTGPDQLVLGWGL